MGGGRGISHVDMPRESQDAEGEPRGGRGISHVDMPRESQDGEGQRYITC